MRLEPSEEMMYRRMDWKERLLLLFPLLGILASVGLLLIGSGRWRIWGVAVVGIAAGALAVLWVPDSRKRDDEFSPHLAEPPEFY